ncbi:MAG: T9SS type A sorting domain-containing protein [Bacteroidia bacterium]
MKSALTNHRLIIFLVKMKQKYLSELVCLILLGLTPSLQAQTAGQKKILFDCTHSETAGNGDWCIDADLHNLDWNPNATTGTGGSHTKSNPQQYPTPTQTAITTSTAETYWEGALSYWAIDCVKKGYWVETLPPITGSITYGNTTNAKDLSKYNVFVVNEPNIIFTATEKTAIMNFISNGGSLFMISDHTVSDRNNDGHDSPAIWNDFLTNNGVQNNAFGFTFALQNFSDASSNSNVATALTDSIIHGPFGTVAEVKWSNGTCMTINPSQNAHAKGHVWKSGKGQTDTAVVCVTSQYGCGRVAAIGDSSPPDDGTGNPSVSLYTGYTGDANGNHRPWLMNMMIWLVEGGCSVTTGIEKNEMNWSATIYPNPVLNEINIQLPNVVNNLAVSIIDVMGREVIISENKNNSHLNLTELNLLPGMYLVKIIADGKNQLVKIIKQ